VVECVLDGVNVEIRQSKSDTHHNATEKQTKVKNEAERRRGDRKEEQR
jgi:hypothetical protein